MTLSIFYDLETTDTCPMGQILNYSFVAVDEDWSIIDECNGLVRVSRLQLPSPGAVLANRVDLVEHQRIADLTEAEALSKIHRFIVSIVERARGDIRLIGFNSSKFDLPFIRTSWIRNGIDPYFYGIPGRVVHGDVLGAAQKLVTTSEEFALMSLTEEGGELKRRLTLQHLSQQFGILQGDQSHESRADVILTIELAKIFKKRFGLDVRTWRSYEGEPLHRTARTGEVFLNLSVEYDLSRDRSFKVVPVTLLDYAGNSSLWIDLDAYRDGAGRKSVMYRNCTDGAFFPAPCPSEHRESLIPIAKAALEEFKHVTARNFFARSRCDIEADIYRLDANGRGALTDAIRNGKKPQTDDADAHELYRRHHLAHWEWGHAHDERANDALLAYAEYRYGGEAIIRKSFDGGEETEGVYHPTLSEMVADLYERLKNGPERDLGILQALESFYRSSDIVRILSERSSPVLPLEWAEESAG